MQVKTNAYGIARFKLRAQSGKPGTYAVFFSAGKIKSAKSVTFILTNQIARVDVVDLPALKRRVDSAAFPHYITYAEKGKFYVGGPNNTAITPENTPVEDMGFKVTVFKVLPVFERTNQTENIETLKKTALGQGKPGVEQLEAVYSLVVEGSKRIKPQTEATNDAEFMFDGVPRHVGEGVYEIDNPRLKVRAEGKFRVQFEVLGIVSSAYDPSHDVLVTTFSNVAKQQIKWLNTLAVFVLAVFMFSGTSAQRGRFWLIVTIFTAIASISLIPIMQDDAGRPWWIMMYCSIGATVFLSVMVRGGGGRSRRGVHHVTLSSIFIHIHV